MPRGVYERKPKKGKKRLSKKLVDRAVEAAIEVVSGQPVFPKRMGPKARLVALQRWSNNQSNQILELQKELSERRDTDDVYRHRREQMLEDQFALVNEAIREKIVSLLYCLEKLQNRGDDNYEALGDYITAQRKIKALVDAHKNHVHFMKEQELLKKVLGAEEQGD